MHLSFDNLDELKDFVKFCGYTHVSEAQLAYLQRDPQPPIDNAQVAEGCERFPEPEPLTGGAEVQGEAEAPKRKRRTKAEMGAERAAVDARVEQEANEHQLVGGSNTQAQSTASDNPFAAQPSANMQAILDAPDQKSAMAAAATAMAAPFVDKTDAQAWIRARATAIGEMNALDHLGKARGFIAKHQMAKYNETFNLAGLQPNVMAYTPADCALHAAAMDFFDETI